MKRYSIIGRMSFVGALVALLPRAQGPDISLGKGDFDISSIHPRLDFEKMKFTEQKHTLPKQMGKDRHSLQKAQIPRRRTGRNR